MYEAKINLSPKEILDKEFKFDAKGYRPQEVDEYLDSVIADYNEFARIIKKLEITNKNLSEENDMLKREIRSLKMEVETISEQSEVGKFTSTNVDLLKRISNLEKIVYGKDE